MTHPGSHHHTSLRFVVSAVVFFVLAVAAVALAMAEASPLLVVALSLGAALALVNLAGDRAAAQPIRPTRRLR